MNEEAMRKAFEAWAVDNGFNDLRNKAGIYIWSGVQGVWQAWQAATRAAVPDGWKAVPMEPTPFMLAEAIDGLGSCVGSCGEATPPEMSDIAESLRCAIAAAPEAKP